jgi:protein required for attachment to host cells
MQTTWVIAADSNRARIFEMAEGNKLREIEDMYNPEGRQSTGEQVSDAEGSFAQGGPVRGGGSTGPGVAGAAIGGSRGQGSTGEPQETWREHDVNMFSKQLVRYLDQARNEHRFDKLRVIAAPKFLGLIRQNMNKEVQKMVEEEIPKEITGLDTRNVEQYIQSLLH